jgi:hypothetical protein
MKHTKKTIITLAVLITLLIPSISFASRTLTANLYEVLSYNENFVDLLDEEDEELVDILFDCADEIANQDDCDYFDDVVFEIYEEATIEKETELLESVLELYNKSDDHAKKSKPAHKNKDRTKSKNKKGQDKKPIQGKNKNKMKSEPKDRVSEPNKKHSSEPKGHDKIGLSNNGGHNKTHSVPSKGNKSKGFGASAYTKNSKINFGKGSTPNKTLIAHELAHVVQQTTSPSTGTNSNSNTDTTDTSDDATTTTTDSTTDQPKDDSDTNTDDQKSGGQITNNGGTYTGSKTVNPNIPHFTPKDSNYNPKTNYGPNGKPNKGIRIGLTPRHGQGGNDGHTDPSPNKSKKKLTKEKKKMKKKDQLINPGKKKSKKKSKKK